MKRLLVVAILVGMVLAGTMAAQDRPGQAALRSWGFLEGTWQIRVVFYLEGDAEGPSIHLQYLQQFSADGRTVLYLPQSGTADFAESRTACVGNWKRSGRHTFDATLYCLWDANWEEETSVPDRIRMKVELEPQGSEFTATPFYYEWYIDGEYKSLGTWGEQTGVRLGIVPIP